MLTEEQAATDRARCKVQLLAVHVAPVKVSKPSETQILVSSLVDCAESRNNLYCNKVLLA